MFLQSCTDSLHILPSSSSGTFPTSSDCTHDVVNTEVVEDVDVLVESFIAVNKQADIGIKQEEIPEDISFPDIKSEPDKVSYVCVCVFLDTFYQCPVFLYQYFMPIGTAPLMGMKILCCHFFWVGVVLCRWEVL
jgi:hypothetical protein